jgi:hypothetical protein
MTRDRLELHKRLFPREMASHFAQAGMEAI